MSIAFDAARWSEIKERSRLWWAGELDGPLIQVRLQGRDPQRAEPELPAQGFQAFYGLETPVEAIVDRWDYEMSCLEYPTSELTVTVTVAESVLTPMVGVTVM